MPRFPPFKIESATENDAGTWKTDADLRLRCMELAVQYAGSALGIGDPVQFAKEFYDFILNQEVSS